MQKDHSDSQQNKNQNNQPNAHNNNNQLVKHWAKILNFQILEAISLTLIKIAKSSQQQNKNQISETVS